MTGTYTEFLAALRMRESSGDYTAVNTLGYLGAYQFGEAALVDLGLVVRDSNPYDNRFDAGFTGKLGITSAADFLATPGAQDAAAGEWMQLLWRYIGAVEVDAALGHVIGGIHLTASGLLAGAHLLGAGGLRDWVETGGSDGRTDAYGTGIGDYLELFGGYNIPFVASATLTGDDRLSGSDGDDRIVALTGADVVKGRAGDDTLLGGAGRDRLKGNAGDDTLRGGPGRDILKSGRDDDRLFGGAHRDRLDGQAGDDRLTGGGGADRFIFRDSGGQDTITDFTDDLDVIVFRDLGDSADILDHATQRGADVLFDFGGGDTLTVLDTTIDALSDDILA
ncbi:hypothetical protein [Aquicoccus sp. SU-CL01552]|uniref:calcium-binding protein n=1 Tax=Aquicoccus sp. SU-CL01552 TaxID=3127656 RepID=UPI003105E98E